VGPAGAGDGAEGEGGEGGAEGEGKEGEECVEVKEDVEVGGCLGKGGVGRLIVILYFGGCWIGGRRRRRGQEPSEERAGGFLDWLEEDAGYKTAVIGRKGVGSLGLEGSEGGDEEGVAGREEMFESRLGVEV